MISLRRDERESVGVFCNSAKRVSYMAIVHTAKWSGDEYRNSDGYDGCGKWLRQLGSE